MKFYHLLDIFTKPFSIKMAQLKGLKPFINPDIRTKPFSIINA